MIECVQKGGRVPEKQIILRVESATLQAFRAECIRRGTTPTQMVTRFIEGQLALWMQEGHAAHGAQHEGGRR